MNTQGIVRNTARALGLLMLVLGLSCCETYRPVTSHFGHGFYRCYYQNTRTGQFYKGVDDTEKHATRSARAACTKAAVDENDMARCLFAECLFK